MFNYKFTGGLNSRPPSGINAPSSGINPALLLPGGTFYWDSTLQTGYSNGDPVGSLANYYPGGTITGSQTGTARPTWQTNSLNGRPGLLFDGINDKIDFNGPLHATGDNSNSLYFLIVSRAGGNGYNGIFSQGTTAAESAREIAFSPNGGSPNRRIYSSYYNRINYADMANIDNNYAIITTTYNQATKQWSDYFINSTGLILGGTITLTAPSVGAQSPRIGLDLGVVNYGAITVYAVAAYSAYHDTATRDVVINTLKGLYGI